MLQSRYYNNDHNHINNHLKHHLILHINNHPRQRMHHRPATTPINEVTLPEVVNAITPWVSGNLDLGQVIDLINSWADPLRYPPD